MRSSRRPVARLVLALTTALLGLATVTAAATADPSTPPSSSAEPPPSSSESPPPSEESSAPPPSAPPSSEPVEQQAAPEDIEVTAAFDKPSYLTAEEMTITLTVRNTGAEPAELLANFPHSAAGNNGIVVTATSTWGAGERFTLAGGESTTNELTGVAVNPSDDTARLHVVVINDGAWMTFTFDVPVTPRAARVSGAVFDDRNGNGNFDSGEGVSGAGLYFTHEVNDLYRPQTETNEAGEFSLEVSPGSYNVRGEAYHFIVLTHSVTVPESGVDGVLFGTVRNLRDLAVDMKFTRGTYEPDEAPTIRVTLTNNGDVPLSGIRANCHHYEGGPTLTGKGAGWGDLADGGVTVAPHASVVVAVTEPMPAPAHDHGYVSADCVFARAGVPEEMYPRVTVYANVPGKLADLSGRVWTSADVTDLSDFGIVLTSLDGCPIIAKTVTGADGTYSIKGVPAGRYYVYIVLKPGWDYKLSWFPLSPMSLVAGKENTRSWWLTPISGTPSAPTPPVCPGDGGPGTTPPAPQPQGSAGTGLAYTGASLLVPGLAGLLALLAGTGAVLVTRRRKPAVKDS